MLVCRLGLLNGRGRVKKDGRLLPEIQFCDEKDLTIDRNVQNV
jgi:hypothetical protein